MEEPDYQTTYDLEGDNWWFVGMRRISLALLGHGPGMPAEHRGQILDVGCGTGIMLEHLGHLGAPVGLDFSSTALTFCRKRGADRLIQARGEELPFADGAFAAVTAFGVIEHIDADRIAIAEWARVLEPGGELVLLTSAYQWLWSGHDVSNHHTRRYRTAEIRDLCRGAGLVPAKVSYVNSILFPPILGVRIVERLRRGSRPPAAHKDTGEVPAPLNRFLIRLLDLERRIVARPGAAARLPFGVSIVAKATKPDGP